VLVNQPTLNVFRVHDPAGSRDYADAAEAVEEATRVSRELALWAARRAGASDPHVETSVTERRARGELAGGYLAEATVRSKATGRPATGRPAESTQAGIRESSDRGVGTRCSTMRRSGNPIGCCPWRRSPARGMLPIVTVMAFSLE
jgi:hypothetical protein